LAAFSCVWLPPLLLPLALESADCVVVFVRTSLGPKTRIAPLVALACAEAELPLPKSAALLPLVWLLLALSDWLRSPCASEASFVCGSLSWLKLSTQFWFVVMFSANAIGPSSPRARTIPVRSPAIRNDPLIFFLFSFMFRMFRVCFGSVGLSHRRSGGGASRWMSRSRR
jgi:hypothetical protein